MRYNLKTVFLTAMATAGLFFTTQAADVVTPPAAHNAEHSDLIAGQLNIGNQIKVQDTEAFLDKLFPDEQEPEIDVYEQGWNSQAVNCYSGVTVPDKAVLDVSKFHMPTKPTIMTSPYGYRPRFGRMHKGVDLRIVVGDTIYAAFDGKVRIVRNEGRRKGYGLYVVIRHTNEMETVYGHLSKFLVKPNDYVKAGDPIALGGNTGFSTGPHLHFETRYMGYAINPSAIFDFKNHTTHTDSYTFTKSTYMNARDYNPSRAEWAKANSTTNTPAKTKAAATSASGAKYYTIRRGDTLSRIAARHSTTVSQICRLNGLSTSSRLSAGKKIRLR